MPTNGRTLAWARPEQTTFAFRAAAATSILRGRVRHARAPRRALATSRNLTLVFAVVRRNSTHDDDSPCQLQVFEGPPLYEVSRSARTLNEGRFLPPHMICQLPVSTP